MAREGLGSLIPLVLVGGVGYWLYSSGMLSSLFGSTTAAPAVPPTTNPPPAGGTNPVPATPPVTPATPPPCGPAGSLAKILALAQKANPSMNLGPSGMDTFSIDQWGYYGNQYCTGLPDQVGWNADTLFPGAADRGGALNWNAAAGYGIQRGMSAVPRRGRRRMPRLIGTNPVRRAA